MSRARRRVRLQGLYLISHISRLFNESRASPSTKFLMHNVTNERVHTAMLRAQATQRLKMTTAQVLEATRDSSAPIDSSHIESMRACGRF
jgi:hypothetical protein